MKIHPQTIYSGKTPEFIVLPIAEYNKMVSILEDIEDIQEIQAQKNNPTETFPIEVAVALSAGQNPVKVFREHRGISQVGLAQKVNVSKQYISQIENGDRAGTARILKAIAKVLRVDLDDIT